MSRSLERCVAAGRVAGGWGWRFARGLMDAGGRKGGRRNAGAGKRAWCVGWGLGVCGGCAWCFVGVGRRGLGLAIYGGGGASRWVEAGKVYVGLLGLSWKG